MLYSHALLLAKSGDGSAVGGVILILVFIAICFWICEINKPKKVVVSSRGETTIEKK